MRRNQKFKKQRKSLNRFTKQSWQSLIWLVFIINYDHVFQYFVVGTLGIILTTILTPNTTKMGFEIIMRNLPLNWYTEIHCSYTISLSISILIIWQITIQILINVLIQYQLLQMIQSYMYYYSHINIIKVGEFTFLNSLLNYIFLKRSLNSSYVYTHIHHADASCLQPHPLIILLTQRSFRIQYS